MAEEKSPLSVGETFKRLIVIGPSRKDQKSRRYYPVACACGNQLEVRKENLTSGHTGSCGCLAKDRTAEAVRTHGMTGTFEYHVWENMIQRCTNPTASGYSKYGRIGIEVCPDWLESFENFFKDMGKAPEGHTLDRKDPSGGYSKENCRWATKSVQAYNTKRRIDNTSGRTGVVWVNSYQKWNARISKSGVDYNLGYFDSFDHAVSAREAAELVHYGFNIK